MKNGTRNFGLLDENFFQIVINSIDMVSTTTKNNTYLNFLIIFTINRQRDTKKFLQQKNCPLRPNMKEIYTASSQKPIAIQDHSRLEHVLMAKKIKTEFTLN